jgi:hypothetical protein
MYRRAKTVVVSMLADPVAFAALAHEQDAAHFASAVLHLLPDLFGAPFHCNSNSGVGPGEETQLVRTLAVAPEAGAAVPQLT